MAENHLRVVSQAPAPQHEAYTPTADRIERLVSGFNESSYLPPKAELATAAGAQAYPGTMVVYAAVPTSGLSKDDAKDYSELIDFAATTGQTPGLNVGQLPPGYLPMTKQNGLANLVAYSLAASQAVLGR